MTDPAFEKIVVDLTRRTFALREICIVLLGLQARSTSDPDAFLREVFSGIDTRLDSVKIDDHDKLSAIESMRSEYDWLDRATRLALGLVDNNDA